MSRSHAPDEFIDPRPTSGEAIPRPQQSDRPDSSREQGPGGDSPEGARLRLVEPAEPAQVRTGEPRHAFSVRGRIYRLRPSEIQTLSEIGKFRAVGISDLREFAYQGDRVGAMVDVKNLIRQRLVSTRKIPHPETSPRRLLTLTKQGHRLLLVTKRVPKNQTIHHGFAKPREAHHDADLYRMYHTAARKIERQGGRNLRVILDYELKKRVYHDIAKLGSDRESPTRKKEIAEKHGLQLVRGKIPLPDLRIEYETRDGEMARVDLELATEHYRGRNLAEKVRAGFSIYAHAQDAAGLRRVLDQRELTAEILSL